MFGLQVTPFLAVGEPDRQVGAGTGETQRMEVLAVEPRRAALQGRIVRLPVCHRIVDVDVDARRRKDRIGEFPDRHVFRVVREDELRPRRVGIGDDGPVDIETGDLLQRGPIGERIRLVGARHLRRVLVGEQHRVLAAHGEPRRSGGKGLRLRLVEPVGCPVEAGVGAMAEAGKRHLVVGEEARHQPRARFIGMFGDEPRQRQRRHGGRHHQILPGRKLQPDLDGDFRQPVQLGGIDSGGRIGAHAEFLG